MQLDEHLKTLGVSDSLYEVMLACADGIFHIRELVHVGTSGYAGTQNVFGEDQLKLDVASNDILMKQLSGVKSVDFAASEEEEIERRLHIDGEFSVAFDPLDGSSLVDVNFAVGTIIGIYPGGSFIGKKPSQMYSAMVAVYGPRTTLFITVKGKGVHQYVLTDGGFELQKESIQVAEEGKYFAPGNLRACAKNPQYKALVDYWLDNQYTLRYSGGMVPDINHILVKGKGIFTYPGYVDVPLGDLASSPARGDSADSPARGKLRLLYECGPMGFLIIEAGGVASDGVISIMNKPLEQLDQRTPFFAGSKKEVEKALEFFIMR